MDGVCGLYGPEDKHLIFKTLLALGGIQSRGGYSTGIAVGNSEGIFIVKGKGSPLETITAEHIRDLQGYRPAASIGCFGYADYQHDIEKNAEPIEINPKDHSRFRVAVTMDGHIHQSAQLREELAQDYRFNTNNQTEIFGALFHKFLEESDDTKDTDKRLKQAGKSLLDKLHGRATFAAPMLVYDSFEKETYLVSLTDDRAFEPLCYGQSGESPVIVSESSGLDKLKTEIIGDFNGGEIFVAPDGEKFEIERLRIEDLLLDMFEPVYFLHPSSIWHGMEAYSSRKALGDGNARYYGDYRAGIGIPVEASGIGMTVGASNQLGILHEGGLVKNPHASRTFQDLYDIRRALEVALKFNVIKSLTENESVLTGDDSIVKASIAEGVHFDGIPGLELDDELRELLSGGAVETLKYGGAKEITMVISYGPMFFPTFKEWEAGPACVERLGVQKLGRRFNVNPFELSLPEINDRMSKMFGIKAVRYTPFSIIRGVIGDGCYQALIGNYPISPEFTPDFIKEMQDKMAQRDITTLLG